MDKSVNQRSNSRYELTKVALGDAEADLAIVMGTISPVSKEHLLSLREAHRLLRRADCVGLTP